MTLRIAVTSDAEKCARVHVAAWQAAYRGLVPEAFLAGFTVEKRTTVVRTSLEAHSEETWLLEEGNEPVAILTIGPNRDEDLDKQKVGELWGIYITPTWWRRGIGTKLVNEAERMLSSRGYEQVVLWVLDGNGPARRFYEAMGYGVDGAEKMVTLGVSLKVVRYMKSLFHQVR
jgi:ribosomal protein S18 acetylase RimI-like enzyme